MIQDQEPWEKDPGDPQHYEGDHPPEPDCGNGGEGPPDASDPPRPDRIDDGATCPDPPDKYS